MFLEKQSEPSREEYFELLSIMGGLSNLFSDSSTPFLHYRIAENVFCKAFIADNLSRSDCSVDARKDGVGIGLKTFLNNNGKTYQKVAEFNKDREKYSGSDNDEFVYKIALLRNKRLAMTQAAHGVSDLFYHCVAREDNKFLIYEEPMIPIDIGKVWAVAKAGNSLLFNDGNFDYNFNISKSTLLKRFKTPRLVRSVPVQIFEDPYELLRSLFKTHQFDPTTEEPRKPTFEAVVLPLFSTRTGDVPENSGLNQWHAQGRVRHPDELYIPVPTWIHRAFPDFFPLKTETFSLKLPTSKVVSAKMCQELVVEFQGVMVDKGKGLMSNPNSELGNWLLRDVLKLKPGELATLETLQDLGIDSVEVRKFDHNHFEIDFKKVGSYHAFEQKHNSY